jgi:hypothetical protein
MASLVPADGRLALDEKWRRPCILLLPTLDDESEAKQSSNRENPAH